MNFSDAMKEVIINGKKVHRKEWHNKRYYIARDKKGERTVSKGLYICGFVDNELSEKEKRFHSEDYIADDWEVYEEQKHVCPCDTLHTLEIVYRNGLYQKAKLTCGDCKEVKHISNIIITTQYGD